MNADFGSWLLGMSLGASALGGMLGMAIGIFSVLAATRFASALLYASGRRRVTNGTRIRPPCSQSAWRLRFCPRKRYAYISAVPPIHQPFHWFIRLQLHALAYNLGNFMRTLAMPKTAEPWSLTSLREKLIKIGAKVVSHGRYVTFQMAEVAVPRQIFQEILSLIARLRAPPAPA
jgi:hypothetical protein